METNIGDIYAIFLGVLLYLVVTGIALIPLIDRWVDNWMDKIKKRRAKPA